MKIEFCLKKRSVVQWREAGPVRCRSPWGSGILAGSLGAQASLGL